MLPHVLCDVVGSAAAAGTAQPALLTDPYLTVNENENVSRRSLGACVT